MKNGQVWRIRWQWWNYARGWGLTRTSVKRLPWLMLGPLQIFWMSQ